MNHNNQAPGSSQSGAAHRTVSVYCTRPRLPGESVYPHPNHILETDILDKSKRRHLVCDTCGMPLILGGGRYVPIERLGSGGFGVTFTAIDLNLGSGSVLNRPRRVVVKQLCPMHHLLPGQLEKVQELFEREAATLTELAHTKIPTLHDHFEEEVNDTRFSTGNHAFELEQQKFFYLVQKQIPGIDLAKALTQHRRFSEPEVERCLKSLLKILNDIHSGSHHASGTPIIHRDIKPANIICSTKDVVKPDGTTEKEADFSNGEFYLIDFGAVKEVVQVVEQGLPHQASAIGSHGFSPPEQFARQPVGFYSDIYALGATCINLLTGQHPYDLNDSNNLNIWKQHASVSPEFAAILDKMLAKSTEERYQSAAEVLQALEQLEEERNREAERKKQQQEEEQRRQQEERKRQQQEEEQRRQEVEQIRKQREQRKKILSALGVLGVGLLALLGLRQLLKSIIPEPPPPDPLLPAQLMSAGEKPIENSIIALNDRYETLKQEGMAAFKAGDYETARDTFAEIRSQAKEEWQRLGNNLETPYGEALQDPTVLIAQNNAEVRQRHSQGEPIYTVAAAIPMNINIGRQMLFGIAQAQDQAVNPQTGEPINLEIVLANDRNIPEQAAVNAEYLAKETFDGRPILAVIGHYLTDSTCIALEEHYAPAGIPVISPLSTAANIRQDCNGDSWFFRTTSSTKIEADTLVNYLVAQIARPRVAIFYNKGDTFSRNLFNEFQSILNNRGGEAIETIDLSEEIDIDATLERVKDVDALAVLPDGRARTDVAFNRAVEVIKANGGEKLVLGSNPLYDQNVINQAGGLANIRGNLILATDWYRECALAGEGQRFVTQAEQEYWFGGVNRTTALAYEAVQAVQATLTPGITPAQIQQKLASGIPTQSAVFANETISFDQNGDRKELTQRILTTPGNNPRSPFDLVQGCPE